MKKFVLTLAAVLSMATATTAFAENENMDATKMYDMNFSMKGLSRALQLTDDQVDAVRDVQATFSAEMLNAATADKADRQALINKAVARDLKYMKALLERDQYRMYLSILNATFVNRGIKVNE